MRSPASNQFLFTWCERHLLWSHVPTRNFEVLWFQGVIEPFKPPCHGFEINLCRPANGSSSRVKFTFLTSLFISPVNEQVTWTLWEPGQNEELQERWDTCAGEQDWPVLFSSQQLSENTHRSNTYPKEKLILCDAKNQVFQRRLLESNHLSRQDPASDENRGSHSHGTTERSRSYFPQILRLNANGNACEKKTWLKPHFRGLMLKRIKMSSLRRCVLLECISKLFTCIYSSKKTSDDE